MAEFPELGVKIVIDLSGFQQSMNQIQRASKKIDAALDDIVASVNKAEAALNNLGANVDVAFDIDISALDRAESVLSGFDTSIGGEISIDTGDIEDALRRVNALDGATPDVTVDVDDGALDEAQTKVRDVDGATPDVTVDVDASNLDNVDSDIRGIDGRDVEVEIEADTSRLDAIEGRLTEIRNLAVIDVFMNLPDLGSIADFPLVSSIIDADNAVRDFNARVRDEVPEAGAIINEVYTQGFGETRTEVAELLADLSNLGTPVDELADSLEAVFTVSELTGEGPDVVISKLNTLVTSGLADNIQQAADVFATGFQNGADSAGDLLDTLQEYSPIMSDLGLTAEEFVSVLSSGLGDGAFNADKVADSLKELNIRIDEALSDTDSAQFDILERIGIVDEAELFAAGEMGGGEFFDGFFKAAQEALASGAITEAELLSLVGGAGEDLTLDVLLDLDFGQVEELEGSTVEIQGELTGDLETSITRVKRIIETELVSAIDEAFDITGFVDQVGDAVSELSDLIQGGADLPEAIEIAFDIPGFEQTFRNFEMAIGNLVIAILQAAASVADAVGRGDIAEQLRGTVADMSVTQLNFDLQNIENPGDAAAAIDLAIARGGDFDAIANAISDAINASAGEGDFAQALNIAEAFDASALGSITQLSDGLRGRFEEGFSEAVEAADLDAALNLAEALDIDASTVQNKFKDALFEAIDTGDLVSALDLAEAVTGFDPQFESLANDIRLDLQDALQDAMAAGDMEAALPIMDALDITGDFQAAFGEQAGQIVSEFSTAINDAASASDADVSGLTDGLASGIEADLGAATEPLDQFSSDVDEAASSTRNASRDINRGFSDIGNSAKNVDKGAGAMEEFSNATKDLSKEATKNLDSAGESFQQFSSNAESALDGVISKIDAAIAKFQAMAAAARDAANAGAGGGGGGDGGDGGGGGGDSPDSNQQGGVFSGLSRVHADELLLAAPPGQDVSVLNAATSNAMLDAVARVLSSMGGLGNGGGGGGETTITVNQTFNTQSTAEDIAALNSYNAAVRGF